jgi:hypothetical protein
LCQQCFAASRFDVGRILSEVYRKTIVLMAQRLGGG